MFEVKPFPPFSWSFSRHTMFEGCKRQYAYHYYASHNGWLRYNVDPEAQHIYRLKQLTTLPLLFGSIVHDLIAKSMQRFFQNREVPILEQLVEEARQMLADAYDDSTLYRAEWWERPKQRTMLYNFYYDEPFDRAEATRYMERLRPTFRHFLQSETWQRIVREPDRYEFIQLEDFSTITLFDHQVFVVLDVLLRDRTTNTFWIIDWKTGKPSPNDKAQLVLYSLYAQLYYSATLDDIRIVNEYLQDGTRTSATPTQLELQHMIDVFHMSVDHMLAYVDDERSNAPASLDSFERTEETWRCARCSYKEVCLPTATT